MKCVHNQLHNQRFLWAHGTHLTWASEPVWTHCEREESVLRQALNPGRLARSQLTDWAVLRNLRINHNHFRSGSRPKWTLDGHVLYNCGRKWTDCYLCGGKVTSWFYQNCFTFRNSPSRHTHGCTNRCWKLIVVKYEPRLDAGYWKHFVCTENVPDRLSYFV